MMFSSQYKSLSWQSVRRVGELQILTRASYLTIALVPLLVAVWPPVELVIKNYNEVLQDSTTKIAALVDKLTPPALPAPEVSAGGTGSANHAIVNLKDEKRILAGFKDVLERIRKNGIMSPWLPTSFALAFFAALAVIIAHLMYQVYAPFEVKQNSRIEYANLKAEAFDQREQTETQFETGLDNLRYSWWCQNRPKCLPPLLERKREGVLKDYEIFRSNLYDEVKDNMEYVIEQYPDVRRDFTNEITDKITMMQRKIGSMYEYDRFLLSDEVARMKRKDKSGNDKSILFQHYFIELFGHHWQTPNTQESRRPDVYLDIAYHEYGILSSAKRPALILTLICYIVGGAIAIGIIVTQSIAVAEATGWIHSNGVVEVITNSQNACSKPSVSLAHV